MKKWPVRALVVAAVQIIFLLSFGATIVAGGWAYYFEGPGEDPIGPVLLASPGLMMIGFGIALAAAVISDMRKAMRSGGESGEKSISTNQGAENETENRE